MKEKWKRWLSLCLAVIMLVTSGSIPGNVKKVGAASGMSRTPGEEYPYYCTTCKYYYTENKVHWCDIPKKCSNCNGTGHLDTTHTCTACKSGTVYCTNLPTYFAENTQINDANNETKFAFSWSCGYCNDSSSGTFTMAGVNSGYLHSPVVVRACTDCDGTGTAFDKCTNCNGTGQVIVRETTSPNKYRITFDANTGVLDGPDYIYESGYSFRVDVSASKDGYDFLGWSKNKEAVSPDPYPILNSPQTYYAIFACRSNTITLDSQGAVNTGTVSIEAVQRQEMPVITPPEREYTITFNKNTADSSAMIGSDSIKDSHIFQGYYTEVNGGGVKYYHTDGSSVKNWDGTEDATLYASWTDQGITLPTAERTGYTFQGWADSPSDKSGAAAGQNYKTSEDRTLYAIWSKNSYTISYDLAGGSVSVANPTVYDVETAAFSLNNPVRNGYTFTGWTGSNGTAGQMNVSIAKGSTGNKNYTASWVAKTDTPYKIEIYKMDLNGSYPSVASEIKNAAGTTDTKVDAANIAKNYHYLGFSYKNAKVGQAVASEMKIDGTGNAVLKLFYERNQYRFDLGTLQHVKAEGTTVSGSYYYGTEISLKAQPDKGYHWVKWQSSEPSLLSDNTARDIKIIMPAGSVTMTPKTEPDTNIPYKVVIHRETLKGDYSDSEEDIIIKKEGVADTGITAADFAVSYHYEGFTYSHAVVYDSKNNGKKGLRMNIDGEGDSELHLYYSRNSYQLTIGTYDTDKVKTANTDITLKYGETLKLKAEPLAGYKFSRWDSSDTTVQADLNTANAAFTMAASNITMTPMAAELTYTVVFEANDSNSSTPENNVRATAVPGKEEYGYSEEITMPGCTRRGFRFLGWSVSKNGKAIYAEGAKVSQLSSIDRDIIKLYAQWEEKQYSIQFQANDSAAMAHNPAGNVKATGITPATAKYHYTDNITLPISGFKRKGFTFLGWSVKEGSNAAEYHPGDLVHSLCDMGDDTVTLYAAWSEKSYLMAFEPGDSYCYGSGEEITAKVSDRNAMHSVRVYYTDGFTMPGCGYVRKGFTFAGWSKNKHASKKTYQDRAYQGELQPGDIVSDLDTAEIHTYYPVWQENKYSVAYHANDNKDTEADGSVASKTVYYTESFFLPKGGFRRTGFYFRGWSAKEGIDEVSYGKEEKVIKLAESGIINLYAAWKETRYQVSFAPNDSYCYGADDGITVKVSNPDAMDSMSLSYTEHAVFPECAYQRKGFTFLGWSKDKNDTKRTYEEEVTAILPGTDFHSLSSTGGELKYYPVWQENKYRILFDANDKNNANNPSNEPEAKGEMAAINDIYYTQEVVLPENQFVRTGFSYKGWSKGKGDNSKQYHNRDAVRGLSFADNDTVLLYAAWKEHSYTIKFKAADEYCYAGTEDKNERVSDEKAMAPVVLKYTDDWDIVTDYKRTGFTFLGYSYSNDNRQAYAPEYQVPFAAGQKLNRLSAKDKEELTVYTIWKENKYQIFFDKNRDHAIWTAHGTKKESYYTENWSFQEVPSCIGYQLKGYAEDGMAEEVNYKELANMERLAGEQEDGERKTIYAVWKPNELTITYESEGTVSEYSHTILYGQPDMIADENITGFYDKDKKEKTFLGWSTKQQNGFGTRADIDYKAGEINSQCFGLADTEAKNELHLYAVWSITVPEIISQTKNSDIAQELKPYTAVTVSVSAIGLDMGYQWYYKNRTENDVSGSAILGATDNSYTIPAEDIIEENDGRSYYCVITGSGGQTESEPVIIHVYGTPTTPKVSIETAINKQGWSNQDISVLFSGSMVKGNKEQSGYLYSFDRDTWVSSERLLWKENTGKEGQVIYFKSYNKDCRELESLEASCIIKKDDESPVITGVKSFPVQEIVSEDKVVNNVTAASVAVTASGITASGITASEIITSGVTISAITASTVMPSAVIPSAVIPSVVIPSVVTDTGIYQIIIYAEDAYSGIACYAIVKETEELKEEDWKDKNIFELPSGQYRAYGMDCAGNIAVQGFTVYPGGYVLLSGESGSYTEEHRCYITGNGTANWDNTMVIDKKTITSVIIQDGITEIPNGFFKGFVNLKEVTIPDSVVNIGEYAFDDVPETMVIYASHGSTGEEAAEKYHYTMYEIEIDGIKDKQYVHYYDNVTIPTEEIYIKGKTLAGWGTVPEEKEFNKGVPITGLSSEMNGYIKLYPVYVDAYIDENGKLHITGDNTKYLDDVIEDKDKITEIVIEAGVKNLPEQIPSGFKNLTDLTIPESLKDISEDRFENMPEGAVLHRPWKDSSEDIGGGNTEDTEDNKGDDKEDNKEEDKEDGTENDNTGDNDKEDNTEDSSTGDNDKDDTIEDNHPENGDLENNNPEGGNPGNGNNSSDSEIGDSGNSNSDNSNSNSNNSGNNNSGNSNLGSGNVGSSGTENGSSNKGQVSSSPANVGSEQNVPNINSGDKETGTESKTEIEIGTTEGSNNGYYISDGEKYDSLEEVLESLKGQIKEDGNRKGVSLIGNHIVSGDWSIPENIQLIVDDHLIINGDFTLSGGELFIKEHAEVIINGSLIGTEISRIHIDGELKVNGKLITSGYLYIGKSGILSVSENGTCEVLSEGILENHGIVKGSIKEHINDIELEKGTIIMKEKVSSIYIVKGGRCKIKALKGVTKWKMKNNRIAKVKKKGGNLILTGRRKGKTVLVGKTKKHTYKYIVYVENNKKKQIRLTVGGKENNKKQILTKSGTVIKSMIAKKVNGKVTLELLYAGKNVKWKLSETEALRKNGNRAIITMNKIKKCTLTAKYQGKIYQCRLLAVS